MDTIMKLLAFSDLHLSISGLESLKKKIDESKPDYLVCAGDVSIFEENLDWILNKLAAFKLPMLAIHGNHETETNMRHAVERYSHFTWIHKKAVEVDGVLFLGFGGGGFAQIEPDFEDWTASIEPKLHEGTKLVLVTHAPPYHTKLDELFPGEHVGVKSFRSWIMRHQKQIVWAISGHIHETAGKTDTLGQARLVNPGGKGKIVVI